MPALPEVNKPLPPAGELITAARTGNAVAWERLVKVHHASLSRLALAILRHKEDAQDVCQEAFHQAFLKLSEWRGECRFDLWLKRIVVNRSRDVLRKRRVRLEATGELARELDEAPLSPEMILSGRESVERILRGMDRLPMDFREVLIPHLLEDLPYGTLAELLNITVNAVRIRIHRGLARLRELIEEESR
jgi:RNA polymerase sigma-70 factor (ECF subfamily)